MKRALLSTACLLLLLAACGSQSAPAARPAAKPDPSPSSSGPQGFQVPGFLDRALKRQMNAKIRRHHLAPLHVKSVTCVEQGRQRATCLAEWSDGDSSTVHVVISADGQTYVSH